MPQKTKKNPVTRQQLDIGSMSTAFVIRTLLDDGVRLDKRTPSKIAHMAKELGWSNEEAAAYARTMITKIAKMVCVAPEPEIESKPEPEFDLTDFIGKIAGLAQVLIPIFAKKNGSNLNALLTLLTSMNPAKSAEQSETEQNKRPNVRHGGRKQKNRR